MRSPILRAEFSHQAAAGGITARPLRLIVRLILSVGLATSLLVFGMEFRAAIDWNFSGSLIQSDTLIVIVGHVLPSVILLPITLMVDVVLVLRTLLLAADAIARERRGRTWQLLILSTQTPRQLVIDKWWATVLHFAPQYLLLAALRVGVIVYVGLERYRIDYFYYGTNSHQFLMQTQPLTFLVAPSTLILGAAVIAAFTLVNLLFTAALGGLIAAIWRSGRTVEQMIFALVLRGILLGFPALVLWSTVAGSPFYDSVLRQTLSVSLVDNGTLISAALLNSPRHQLNFLLTPTGTGFYLTSLIPYLLSGYVLLAAGTLAIAVRRVARKS